MMADAQLLLRAVADATRQRLLRVLAVHELTVSELVEVLGQPQSTISRHLKVLREAGLLTDRRAGTTVCYVTVPCRAGASAGLAVASVGSGAVEGGGLAETNGGASEADNGAVGLRNRLLEWCAQQPLDEPTRQRLMTVVHRRAAPDRFFAVAGRRWDQLRIEAFGDGFHLEALTSLLPADWQVADVGAGTGYMLGVLARRFRKVIAIDPTEAMLEIARSRPEVQGRENVEFRLGSAEQMPVADGALDLVMASLVLHHMPEPDRGLAEFHRCLRPGGRLAIIEQQPHRLAAFHERMGDLWWGVAPDALSERVREARFGEVRVSTLASAVPSGSGRVQAPGLYVLVADKATRPDGYVRK